MTTREMARIWRVCEMCHGAGRLYEGALDWTCPHPRWGGCHGTGMMACPSCHHGKVRLGHEVCDHCETDDRAA